jgi:hypothetical protein
VDDVRRLVHEHLNAAMIMVPLDDPLDPEMPLAEALAYLDENEFDLALLRTADVRIVYRARLKQVPEDKRENPVKAWWSSPRGDRLIEHSLELGEVARRLSDDDVPLLVVGRGGLAFIITRADFTRPAGLAGVLAVIAALDGMLDGVIREFDEPAWDVLDEERRADILTFVERARGRSEEVHRLSYLTLRERFLLVRELRVGEALGVDLETQAEHDLVVAVRNDIAHGRPVRSGSAAIAALETAERLLDALARVPKES